jgi:hypothetical protein
MSSSSNNQKCTCHTKKIVEKCNYKEDAKLKVFETDEKRLFLTFKALMPSSPPSDLKDIMIRRGFDEEKMKELMNEYNRSVSLQDNLHL